MAIRAFKEIKDNLIESINEVFLLLIICYLWAISNEDKWTKTMINWFLYILIINTVIVLLIITIGTIVVMYQFVSQRRKKAKKMQIKVLNSTVKHLSNHSNNGMVCKIIPSQIANNYHSNSLIS